MFIQAVAGFAYLERAGILHRDIRSGNLMVGGDGVLKIIDLGFGKKIEPGFNEAAGIPRGRLLAEHKKNEKEKTLQ